MDSRPNLFDDAVGELAQDAFVCWLARWADPRFAGIDAAMHHTGRLFIDRLIGITGGDYRSIEVERQHAHIDVLINVNNGERGILIEDKVHTSEHSDQLCRYAETLRKEGKFRSVTPVYLKTGDQSDYAVVINAEYAKFSRADMLAVLAEGTARGVNDRIFLDFHDHLRRIDERRTGYATTPMTAWTGEQWTGFFMDLQKKIPGQWAYVPNRGGGFMCFHWHWNERRRYLQLQQHRLCFKLEVRDESRRISERDAWRKALTNQTTPAGNSIKATRRSLGTWMTVAEWPGDYRVGPDGGLLDFDATLDTLRGAERLMDAADKIC